MRAARVALTNRTVTASPREKRPWRARHIAALGLALGAGTHACNASSERQAAARSAEVVGPLPSDDPTPEAASAVGALNVVLILIDSLRYDMPWLGYQRAIAPWLTAFERRSVSYTHAYALSNMTARSVGALLAGRYPSELHRDGNFFTTYYPENVFVSERAAAAGHITLCAHAHAYFVPETGITQGFQTCPLLDGTRLNNMSKDNITSKRMTELAERLLSNAAAKLGPKRRLFAYFHYMDPHAPYLPHEGRPSFGTKPRDLYDQEVHFTDEWVGKLVEFILARPWGRKTAIVITSDHGEAFAEHGFYKHGYELFEEMIRVPMLIYAPGVSNRRIDTPRSHIDLAPTIMEWLGLPPDPELPGVSLVPELEGGPSVPRPVIVDLPRDRLQDRRRALIEGDLKLIALNDDTRFLLFDLAQDPGEKNDLIVARKDLRQRALARYRELSDTIQLEPIRGFAELKGAPPGRRW